MLGHAGTAALCSSLLVTLTACLESPPPTAQVSGRLLQVAESIGPVDLSVEGSLNWVHWGLGGIDAYNRKRDGTLAISHFTVLGGAGDLRSLTCCADVSWSDGIPTETANNVGGGVNLDTPGEQGDGFEFTVDADEALRTLKIYTGTWCSRIRLEATMLSNGAQYVDDTFEVPEADAQTAIYSLDFQGASAGDRLRVAITIADNHCITGDLGEAWLIAATLR